MNTLQERESNIIELFEWIEDDTDRYVQLIDHGKTLLPLDDTYKTELYEVKGCQSKVWLHHEIKEGKIHFFADSNTAITKGIVSILVYLWSGLAPNEITNASLEILEKIELKKHLTSQRSNGLTAMISQMKNIANQYG